MDNNDLKALVNKYHAEIMKLIDDQKKSTPNKEFANEKPAAETLKLTQPPTINEDPTTQKTTIPNKEFINPTPAAENLEEAQTSPADVPFKPTTTENPTPIQAAPPTEKTAMVPPKRSNPILTTPVPIPPTITKPATKPQNPTLRIPNEVIPPEFVQFLQENPDYGFLTIQTYEAEQALPVAYAKITISKDFDDYTHIFYSSTTGISGTVENLALPAPNRDLSTYPSASTKMTSYDIRVEHPKYHPEEEHLHAEIFDGIKSIQLIQMSPNTP